MKTKPRQLLSTSGSNKYKYVLRHSPTPQRAIWGIHIHTHCWRWKHEASRGEARSRLCNMRIDGKYQSLTIYIGYNGLGFPLDSRRNIPRLWNQKGPSGQLIWVPKSPPLGLIDMKNVCSNQLRPPTLCDRPARGEDTKWISADTWWFMLNTADYTTLWMRKLMIFTAKRGCLNLSIRKEENWKNLIMRILLPKAFLIKLYWNWIYATVVIIWIN